jgi:hypothetical protein
MKTLRDQWKFQHYGEKVSQVFIVELATHLPLIVTDLFIHGELVQTTKQVMTRMKLIFIDPKELILKLSVILR